MSIEDEVAAVKSVALDYMECAEEHEEVSGMLLRRMLEHHASLKPKPTLTKDAALASLMPWLDFYIGDDLAEYEAGLASGAAAATEEDGLVAAQEWRDHRYVEYFREAHLGGLSTLLPGFNRGGCVDATQPAGTLQPTTVEGPEMIHADKNSAARRCSPGFEIRRVERQPSGVTRSCGSGAKGPQQRQLGRTFCLPTQWASPAGRHENIEARDIFFMALKKICNLESEAEAQGCRFSATARCWEGRSQRLPTPCRRLMARVGRRQPGLTLRDGVLR